MLPDFAMTAKEHYDNHLGHFYSWMTGDLQIQQLEHQKMFSGWSIFAGANSRAVDLGCGHGIQSIALAHLGFQVEAVDFNAQLLNELSAGRGNLPITLHNKEMLQFLEALQEPVELITCMGDTLIHLESAEEVDRLIQLCSQKLVVDGTLVLSFRDLSTELKSANRFIPVKSDAHRILTCFLEYVDTKVMVYDILWEKEKDSWQQKISCYPKLRLSESTINTFVQKAGLVVKHSSVINRMIYLVAAKPQASTH